MFTEIERHIEAMFPEQTENLQKLIRIESIADISCPRGPYGPQVEQALDFVAALAQEKGLRVTRVGRSGVFAEWGTGDRVAAAFSHIDVVPAGDGWSVPAFSGLIRDGVLYGRGSVDNKGPALGCLYALAAIRQICIEPGCRLRVYFGGCEETGMLDIVPYLEEFGHPDAGFIPDSSFPLAYAERGVLFLDLCAEAPASGRGPAALVSLHGGTARNTVPPAASACVRFDADAACTDACERLLQFARTKKYELSAQAQGRHLELRMARLTAHANSPEFGKNAVVRLLDCLKELPLEPAQARVVRGLTEKIGAELDGASMGIRLKTESGELVQNLSSLDWENGSMRAVYNVRYPYEGDKQQILDRIFSGLSGFGISVRIQDDLPSVYLERESALVQALYGAYSSVTGDRSPMCAAGATYAKYIRNAVPFGSIFPGEIDWCHQADEHAALGQILTYTKIYAKAFCNLSALLETSHP